MAPPEKEWSHEPQDYHTPHQALMPGYWGEKSWFQYATKPVARKSDIETVTGQ